MPRPILIVGIGGTGQWVLTWLKRDLLETYGTPLPAKIQLLAFDTTTTVEAAASHIVDEEEQEVRIGDVVLEAQKEFVHLGGDAYDFAREIRDGRYPHIAQWFEAKFWLERLNPSAFILEEGAGRIRPLGRLALFRDIIVNGGRNILNPLRTKLLAVRDAIKNEPGQKITIAVVASFAGGTGSGLFLDISLLLYALGQQYSLDYTMAGFFVLPWAFTPHPNDEMKARSFAAWRELNRFMVVRDDFPMHPIIYDPEDPQGRVQPRRRLFDYVYLVDGRFREGGTMGEEAQYGPHAALASTLFTLFIDEHAAQLYHERILTNLHPIYARNPGNPLYSTLGLKQFKIPAYYIRERDLLNLEDVVLERLLMPRQRTSLFEPVIEDINWLRNVAAVDQNPEDPGVAGRERAHYVFLHSVQYRDLVGTPTRFIARLGDLLQKSREDRRRVVETLARAGLGRGASGWIAYFPDLGDDPKYRKLREAIEAHTRFDVRKSYGRRKGEKGTVARRRFRDLPEEMRKRFGIVKLEGGREDEYQGEFGELLTQVSVAQADIFRHLLRLHLLRILNGTDPDPLKARTGKLGYAWDFLNGVVDALEHLIALMDEVWQFREEKVRPQIRIAERLKRAEEKLKRTHNKVLCFLLPMIEHPDVRRAEEIYLRAWQEYIDARREDLMHRAVRATLEAMKEIALKARERVRHWILHLSTGDVTSGVYGLWRQAQNRKRLLEEMHGYDRRLKQIQILLEDEQAFRRWRAEEELLRQILAQIEWDVDVTLRVKQILQPRAEHEEARELGDPFQEEEVKWREETSLENFQKWHTYMEAYVPREDDTQRAAQYIKQKFGRSEAAVQEFAQTYELSQVPVIARVEGKAPKESTLIAVQSQPNDSFFYGASGLEGELRALHKLARERIDDNHPIMAVNLESPYKLVILHTEELHPLKHYRGWEECQEAYEQHIHNEYHELNPVHLHIFAAEALAAEIERRLIRERGRKYKALSPRVVLLLANRKRLRLFFWMWAMKFVRETPKGHIPYYWEFSLPEDAHPTIWLTPPWDPHESSEQKRPRPDILSAAHGFVIHGQTYEPGRSWRIRYDAIEKWLRNHWQQRRDEQIAFLEAQRDVHQPDSLATYLNNLIKEAEREGDDVKKEEYESLLYVMDLFFEDEIRWLKS